MTDMLSFAWLTVTRHKVRSLLAVFGAAVGICALTSIVSVEKSWQRAVMQFFSGMDMGIVEVSSPRDRSRGPREARPRLDSASLKSLVAGCPTVSSATAVSWAVLAASYGRYALEVPIRAIDADYCVALPTRVWEGRFFTALEASSRTAVCVLDLKTRLSLFGDDPAVGQEVRLGATKFRVIGVVTASGRKANSDGEIFVPSAWSRFLLTSGIRRARTSVFARVADPKAAHAQIAQALQRRVQEKCDDCVSSLWKQRELALRSRQRTTLYTGLAAVCALFVAGLGIAGLLFVSTAERTREIGICRALGATWAHLLGEYLGVSLMLSGAGCLVGVVLGIPAAMAGVFASRWDAPIAQQNTVLLGGKVATFPKVSEIVVTISWEAIAIAVAFATLSAIVAAIAPAWEAMRLDPARAIAEQYATGAGTQLRKALASLQIAFGVLVLIVPTSFFAAIQQQEHRDARRNLGQDRLSASADPVAALRRYASKADEEEYRQALADLLVSTDIAAVLRQRAPLLQHVTPVVPAMMDIAYADQTLPNVQILFTTSASLDYHPGLEKGDTGETAKGFDAGSPVVILDTSVSQFLFDTGNPLHRRVNVAGTMFTVCATRPASETSFAGTIWLPLSFYRKLQPRFLHESDRPLSFRGVRTRIDAQPSDTDKYTEANMQFRDALLPLLPERAQSGIAFSADVPATMRDLIMQQKAAAARGTVGALAVLLIALAGLANMLLVSVHTEIWETGVRRALGATRADVIWHFLSEGTLLSAAGVVAGVLLGILACWLTKTQVGLPVSVSGFWICAGAVAVITAGTLISLVPALIAARLSVVTALRS
ncbi:MAG: ABC transporter permease [Armatimonadota bacterium]|jgi:putative ABC transport system permease protein